MRNAISLTDDRQPLHHGAAALALSAAVFEAQVEALCLQLQQRPSPIDDHAACEQLRQQIVSCFSETLGRLQKAESRYRALLEHAHETIAVLTPDGYILEVNREAETVHQLPRERLVGHHIREFIAPGHEQAALEGFSRIVAAGTGRSPVIPIVRPDGSRALMEFSGAQVEVDGETVVLAIGRDLTDTLEAQARLEAGERKYRLLVRKHSTSGLAGNRRWPFHLRELSGGSHVRLLARRGDGRRHVVLVRPRPPGRRRSRPRPL